MIRVLYIDANAITLNPSSTYLPNLITESSDTIEYYGPGYRSAEELKLGLKHWVETTGPYNFLVIGANTPFFFDDVDKAITGLCWHLKNNTANHFTFRKRRCAAANSSSLGCKSSF